MLVLTKTTENSPERLTNFDLTLFTLSQSRGSTSRDVESIFEQIIIKILNTKS